MRKPRPFGMGKNMPVFCAFMFDEMWASVDVNTMLDARECERLAAWLLKAAKWIREQGGK